MLTHAEVEIAPVRVSGSKAGKPSIQVWLMAPGRPTADEFGDFACQGIDRLARGYSRSHAFFVWRNTGRAASQPAGSWPPDGVPIRRVLREKCLVGFQAHMPFGFQFAAVIHRVRKKDSTSAGMKKRGSFGQPSFSLAPSSSLSPGGSPWALLVSCRVAAEANMRVAGD